MEGTGCHVSIVEKATNEGEGCVTRGEDDLVGELEAEVVGDQDEEVGEVAEGGGDLGVGMACEGC